MGRELMLILTVTYLRASLPFPLSGLVEFPGEWDGFCLRLCVSCQPDGGGHTVAQFRNDLVASIVQLLAEFDAVEDLRAVLG